MDQTTETTIRVGVDGVTGEDIKSGKPALVFLDMQTGRVTRCMINAYDSGDLASCVLRFLLGAKSFSIPKPLDLIRRMGKYFVVFVRLRGSSFPEFVSNSCDELLNLRTLSCLVEALIELEEAGVRPDMDVDSIFVDSTPRGLQVYFTKFSLSTGPNNVWAQLDQLWNSMLNCQSFGKGSAKIPSYLRDVECKSFKETLLCRPENICSSIINLSGKMKIVESGRELLMLLPQDLAELKQLEKDFENWEDDVQKDNILTLVKGRQVHHASRFQKPEQSGQSAHEANEPNSDASGFLNFLKIPVVHWIPICEEIYKIDKDFVYTRVDFLMMIARRFPKYHRYLASLSLTTSEG